MLPDQDSQGPQVGCPCEGAVGNPLHSTLLYTEMNMINRLGNWSLIGFLYN